MYDKNDMTKEELYEIAEEVNNYWKGNCLDEDFFKNCINSICIHIGFEYGPVPDIVYDIWNIIENDL